MFTYTPLWIGPVDKLWLKEHGFKWSYGRANIYKDGKFTGNGVYFPLMLGEDFVAFSAWLENFFSDVEYGAEELMLEFEKTYFELELHPEFGGLE